MIYCFESHYTLASLRVGLSASGIDVSPIRLLNSVASIHTQSGLVARCKIAKTHSSTALPSHHRRLSTISKRIAAADVLKLFPLFAISLALLPLPQLLCWCYFNPSFFTSSFLPHVAALLEKSLQENQKRKDVESTLALNIIMMMGKNIKVSLINPWQVENYSLSTRAKFER